MNSIDRLHQIMDEQNTEKEKTPSDVTPRVWKWLTPDVRAWLYSVILAVIPILGTFGYVNETTAPLWIALAAAILGMGTAVVHKPHNGDADDQQ